MMLAELVAYASAEQGLDARERNRWQLCAKVSRFSGSMKVYNDLSRIALEGKSGKGTMMAILNVVGGWDRRDGSSSEVTA